MPPSGSMAPQVVRMPSPDIKHFHDTTAVSSRQMVIYPLIFFFVFFCCLVAFLANHYLDFPLALDINSQGAEAQPESWVLFVQRAREAQSGVVGVKIGQQGGYKMQTPCAAGDLLMF